MRILGLLIVLISLPLSAQTDMRGSSDFPAFERFPLSYIVAWDQRKLPEYRVVLGELEKVNGVVRAERDERVKGERTRITYRIPDGHTAAEPFNFWREQLARKGAEELFVCAGRDCGSSNYWANSVFRVSRLYGVDTTQNYLVARQGALYYVIYTVTRGNKRVFAHLEVISAQNGGLVAQLQAQGFTRLPQEGELPAALIEHLRTASVQSYWLVGVDRTGGTVDASLERSEQLAQAYLPRLNSALEGDVKIQVRGLGALAPMMIKKGEAGVFLIRE